MRSFQKTQLAFAAHLRDPQVHPAPAGIEDRRLKIYRELFYNNVEGALANAFPVLRTLSSDTVWQARVRDFYARHTSHAPQFHKLAEEFLSFLEHERGEHADDPPFLRELCHYEWVELALSVSEQTLGAAHADGDLLDEPLRLSPLAWPLAYDYPVHRIAPDFQPTAPSAVPTYLIVYRDRSDDVRFMEINAVTARLLQLLETDANATGRALLLRIAAELQHPDAEAVVREGAAILRDLRDRDILVGTRV